MPALLSEALPEGMAITGVVPLVDRAPALQEAVTVVGWQVEIEPVAGRAASASRPGSRPPS